MFTSSKPSILLVLYIFCFHEEPCFWHCCIFIIIMAILVLFWFQGPRDPYACAYGFFKRLDCLEVFPLSHFHDHHDFGFDAKLKTSKCLTFIDLTFSSLLSWFRIQRHWCKWFFCWRFIIYYVVIRVYVLCITRWLWWVVMLLQNIQQFWIATIHNVLFKTMTIDVQ